MVPGVGDEGGDAMRRPRQDNSIRSDDASADSEQSLLKRQRESSTRELMSVLGTLHEVSDAVTKRQKLSDDHHVPTTEGEALSAIQAAIPSFNFDAAAGSGSGGKPQLQAGSPVCPVCGTDSRETLVHLYPVCTSSPSKKQIMDVFRDYQVVKLEYKNSNLDHVQLASHEQACHAVTHHRNFQFRNQRVSVEFGRSPSIKDRSEQDAAASPKHESQPVAQTAAMKPMASIATLGNSWNKVHDLASALRYFRSKSAFVVTWRVPALVLHDKGAFRTRILQVIATSAAHDLDAVLQCSYRGEARQDPIKFLLLFGTPQKLMDTWNLIARRLPSDFPPTSRVLELSKKETTVLLVYEAGPRKGQPSQWTPLPKEEKAIFAEAMTKPKSKKQTFPNDTQSFQKLVTTTVPSTQDAVLPTASHHNQQRSLPMEPVDRNLSMEMAVAATANQLSNLPTPSDDKHRRHMHQLTATERELQGRYYRSLDTGSDLTVVRCLACGQRGHMPETCPFKRCDSCRTVADHDTKDCPFVGKCAKCREWGHNAEACPHKLKRSLTADGLHCDVCHSDGHTEDNCPCLWRTFDRKGDIRRVEVMRVSCYNCASNLHWGDDCPLRLRNVKIFSDTFSASHANRYILPGGRLAQENIPSRSRELVRAAPDKSRMDEENDDDDDVQFVLERRIERPRPPGDIQMNVMNHEAAYHRVPPPATFQLSELNQHVLRVDPIISYHPISSPHNLGLSAPTAHATTGLGQYPVYITPIQSPPLARPIAFEGTSRPFAQSRRGGRSFGNASRNGTNWQPPLPDEPLPTSPNS